MLLVHQSRACVFFMLSDPRSLSLYYYPINFVTFLQQAPTPIMLFWLQSSAHFGNYRKVVKWVVVVVALPGKLFISEGKFVECKELKLQRRGINY